MTSIEGPKAARLISALTEEIAHLAHMDRERAEQLAKALTPSLRVWLESQIEQSADQEPRKRYLTPCPFCGGAAHYAANEFRRYWIHCKTTNCIASRIGATFGSSTEVIDAWNLRIGTTDERS